jgi:hypothetical protein
MIGGHMIIRILSIALLLPISAIGQTPKRIPFDTDGIRSIIGKNLCDFQGEFPEQSGVYLDGKMENAVHYQQQNGIIAVFLLNNPSGRCGMVDAALDLTPLIRKGETLEFKCYTANEGGTTWEKWGHLIGMANNQGGRKRFVKPRLAWRVDIKGKHFEKVTDRRVTCDTSGYAN